MADWSSLRRRLNAVEDRHTLDWQELDELVGGLPRSAYDYTAFWSGARSAWSGFRATDVRVGHSVTFVRVTEVAGRPQPRRVHPPRGGPTPLTSDAGRRPDVVLVGCVKSKVDHPAPAKDLYVSPLFLKARAYAEATAPLWFILSAEHGLVHPDSVLEPYDLRLSASSPGYRRNWGLRVVGALESGLRPLAGKVIEIHAGSSYADAIRDELLARGAVVREPLAGFPIGNRLAWYTSVVPTGEDVREVVPTLAPEVDELVAALRRRSDARTPAQLLATGGAGLGSPGLYSWWVDVEGAAELTRGLGHVVSPGLIYAGQAGATRSRSGQKSKNTLWGRLQSMHLKGNHEFSTFRRSLGSVLAEVEEWEGIDEALLTAWMHEHLQVVTVAVADADGLGALEGEVLTRLDPPLNLSKVPANPLRRSLSELRRRYSRPSPTA